MLLNLCRNATKLCQISWRNRQFEKIFSFPVHGRTADGTRWKHGPKANHKHSWIVAFSGMRKKSGDGWFTYALLRFFRTRGNLCCGVYYAGTNSVRIESWISVELRQQCWLSADTLTQFYVGYTNVKDTWTTATLSRVRDMCQTMSTSPACYFFTDTTRI